MTAVAAPTPLSLTRVELRKMVDTRAGLWLMIITALGAAAVVVLTLIFADERSFADYFSGTLLAASILLPILGILAVTSEWSHRTGLTTFALVPRRSRVVVAKSAAALVLGLASVAACLAVAALGTLIGGDEWNLTWQILGQAALLQVLNVLMGVGFGMLLMNSALAIVVYFLLPTVWLALSGLVEWLREPSQWLNFALATDPLSTGTLTGGEGWAKAGTATALWVAAPLIAGTYRLIRRELS